MKRVILLVTGLLMLLPVSAAAAALQATRLVEIRPTSRLSHDEGYVTTFMLRTICGSDSYRSLLARFPESQQGLGAEWAYAGMWEQSMSYALILSAESLRQQSCPNTESVRRIRAAVTWLVANADLDGDGKPGWGLPWEFDAFADGTTNPPDEPYTITTAIVVQGLLDALQTPNVWSTPQRTQMRRLIAAVAQHWLTDVWRDLPNGGGYFPFTAHSNDAAYFIPNVSAMMTGVLARFLAEHPTAVPMTIRRALPRVVDSGALGVARAVQMRDGAPFWRYWQYANPPDAPYKDGPNNLVHHVYIIHGMELYRRYRGVVQLPWSTHDAGDSLDRFLRDDRIYDVPQDAIERPSDRNLLAVLWSAGSLVAWEAAWGDQAVADENVNRLMRDYGQWPALTRVPGGEAIFYPRQAAHVLWAMALREFGGLHDQ